MSKIYEKWIRISSTFLLLVFLCALLFQLYFDGIYLFENKFENYKLINFKEYAIIAYLLIFFLFLIRKKSDEVKKLTSVILLSGFLFDICIFKSFENLRYLVFYEKSVFYSLLILIINPIFFSSFFIAKNKLLGNNSKNIVYLIIILVLIIEILIFKGKKWETLCIDNVAYPKFLTMDLKDNEPYISYSPVGRKAFILSHFTGKNWIKSSFKGKGIYKSISMMVMKFDRKGKMYVCYLDNNLALTFATFEGNNWKSIKVFGNVSSQSNVSLDFDSFNRPCISFAETSADSNTFLCYAKYDGKKWEIHKIDSIGKLVLSLHSLVLDSEDNPHLSYYDGHIEKLKYAFFHNSKWNVEVVEDKIDVGRYSSVAIGKSGEVYICYSDYTNDCVKLATIKKGKCRIEMVDSHSAGNYNRIKVDSEGNLHICYSDGGFKYAFYNGNNWKIEYVERSWEVPHEEVLTNLSLNSNGNPLISYFDEKSRCIIFARRKEKRIDF